jgi:hypothetical protein
MSTIQFLSALAAFDTLRRNGVVQLDVQHRNIMTCAGVRSRVVIIDFNASLLLPDADPDRAIIRNVWALCNLYDPKVAVVRQWRLSNSHHPMV